jgi:predicted GTPase
VQHSVSDRDAGRELHTIDTERQQPDAVDLLDLVGADDVAGRHQFRQDHRDGLQRLDLFLVVLPTRAILHDQHAQHATSAYDRHAG